LADVELQKLQELRQKLVEKNLNGVYSDEMFKQKNKLLEEKIKGVQTAKSETVLEKYNLEAIAKFIQNKFTDLNKTFTESLLKQKRVLVCSIFPQGLSWSYPGYSNTQISPFYLCLMQIQDGQVPSGTADTNNPAGATARSGSQAVHELVHSGTANPDNTYSITRHPQGWARQNICSGYG